MADNQPQPLQIPRSDLIARLEERHQEAQAARQAAQDARTASRKALVDAVAQFTPDQVANILDYYVTTTPDLLKWVQEKLEANAFVSEDIAPTGVETTLEKLLRVLNLANNTTIEVYPSDPIYSYI